MPPRGRSAVIELAWYPRVPVDRVPHARTDHCEFGGSQSRGRRRGGYSPCGSRLASPTRRTRTAPAGHRPTAVPVGCPQGTFRLNPCPAGPSSSLLQSTALAPRRRRCTAFRRGLHADAPPVISPGHANIDASLGRKLGNNCCISVAALNLANRQLLVDNTLTFDGVHYNNPREIYAEICYRFNY
jgi:hypothetical protein